jgi:hypothetical protein
MVHTIRRRNIVFDRKTGQKREIPCEHSLQISGRTTARMCAGSQLLTEEAAGEVAEWPIVQHWKCCVRVTGPGVRIPPSPLHLIACEFVCRTHRFFLARRQFLPDVDEFVGAHHRVNDVTPCRSPVAAVSLLLRANTIRQICECAGQD